MKVKLVKYEYIYDQFEIRANSVVEAYEILRKRYIGRIVDYKENEITFRVFKEVSR